MRGLPVELVVLLFLLCIQSCLGFLYPRNGLFRLQRSVKLRSTTSSGDLLCNNDGDGEKDAFDGDFSRLERRSFIRNGIFTASSILMSRSAEARGLVKFPCKDYAFLNTYHFFRAGESLLEEEGIWSTNPLFLTNREAALSGKGIEQVCEMCKELRSDGLAPTVVRYSLAAAAIDSADIIGNELNIGRDRIVPEFNYMDPRAVGSWDMSQVNMTKDAVWALDVDEAGRDGIGGCPPSNEDGTPHETLSDQVVRLQNLLSVLETLYSGDTILLVFPDGAGPALLTCLIGGIPLNRVHEFEYKSGEVGLNINYESAHALVESKPSDEYTEAIIRGREKLKKLLDNPDDVLNVRDQQYAEEWRQGEELKAETAKQAQAQKDLESEEKARTQQLQQSNQPAAKESSFDSSTLTVGGIAAIGIIGAVALFGDNSDERPPVPDSGTDSTQDNIDDDADIQNISGIPDSFLSKRVDFGEIISKSKKSEEVSATRENIVSPAKTSDSGNRTTVAEDKSSDSTVNKLRPAPPAWDSDEDDGGVAWLGALSEMMNEDIDDETVDESGSFE